MTVGCTCASTRARTGRHGWRTPPASRTPWPKPANGSRPTDDRVGLQRLSGAGDPHSPRPGARPCGRRRAAAGDVARSRARSRAAVHRRGRRPARVPRLVPAPGDRPTRGTPSGRRPKTSFAGDHGPRGPGRLALPLGEDAAAQVGSELSELVAPGSDLSGEASSACPQMPVTGGSGSWGLRNHRERKHEDVDNPRARLREPAFPDPA